MKKLTIVIVLIISIHVAFASENKVELNSNIKEVTVFQKGAQVFRVGSTYLNPGVTDIVLTDLSSNINQQSIQVKGFGNFTILSVNYQLNYLKTQKQSKEIKILSDSLLLLKYKKLEIENKIEVYTEEESVLNANQSIGGDQSGVSVIALKEIINYVHTKRNEIKSMKLELKRSLDDITENINRIQNQLNSLQSRYKNPTSEVLVQVLAKEKTKAVFDLKYVIYNAGWTPEYDFRAIDITKPVQLNYKAKVYQSSGEDWENVLLSISTGNPQISGVKPELYPWYVNFYESPQVLIPGAASMQRSGREMEKSSFVDFNSMESVAGEEASYGNFESSTNQTNVEFNIDIPYTIPSDGKAYAVQINKFELDADYTYYAAPKLLESAFLLAQITGWEQYNLLAGSASIFFEGTYVGSSSINPKNANDTLNLSLGRDESIVVSRTKIKDFESRKILGVNKKEEFGYEIQIRNTKNADILILVEDQFPISQNKEIQIEQIEKSGAQINATTGKLRWKFELKSLEEKKLEMKYSVKYPKDKQIGL